MVSRVLILVLAIFFGLIYAEHTSNNNKEIQVVASAIEDKNHVNKANLQAVENLCGSDFTSYSAALAYCGGNAGSSVLSNGYGIYYCTSNGNPYCLGSICPTTPCDSNCAVFTTCSTCISSSRSCGWCPSSGTCLAGAGTQATSTRGTCNKDSLNWIYYNNGAVCPAVTSPITFPPIIIQPSSAFIFTSLLAWVVVMALIVM